MKKLYIMCGVTFSGKSTLAQQIAEHKEAVLVSQDAIWFEHKEEWNLDMSSDEDWERIQQISRAEIRQKLSSGSSVVYDDIGLKNSGRESLCDLARESGAQAILVYVDTPQYLRQRRQAHNLVTMERHDVPEHIVTRGLIEFEVPLETESPHTFTPDTDLGDWLKGLP
jgi:predicted kinase